MSFSLKLQIIRSLDSSTRLTDGIAWFYGAHPLQTKTDSTSTKPDTGVDAETGANAEPGVKTETGAKVQTATTELHPISCYHRTVKVMLNKQVVRATVALTAFMRKLHIYRAMDQLHHALDR
jgi:hypothetical protein